MVFSKNRFRLSNPYCFSYFLAIHLAIRLQYLAGVYSLISWPRVKKETPRFSTCPTIITSTKGRLAGGSDFQRTIRLAPKSSGPVGRMLISLLLQGLVQKEVF